MAAVHIAQGCNKALVLGNIGIVRDWGWAPEYVEAMWRLLRQAVPEDFVIATGRSYSSQEFVEQAFSIAGLDWQEWVKIDPHLLRPSDLECGYADPDKAARKIDWRARYCMPNVVRFMIEGERRVS